MKYHLETKKNHKSAVMNQPDTRQINLLQHDICLPAALIKKDALENNIRWMQRYAQSCNVSLSPHGKTTMTPAIFQLQQAAGAWAISVGTPYQAEIAAQAGIKRIIIANQIVGLANIMRLAQIQAKYDVTLYCCVDNIANASALSDYFSSQNQCINVLIELGVLGGRCGCRTLAEAEVLAEHIITLEGLCLAGVEVYEGVLHGDNALSAVSDFLQSAAKFVRWLDQNNHLSGSEIILTGAGSSWYDVVCRVWSAENLPSKTRIVIRPGCYLTHDEGVYKEAQETIIARDSLACDLDGDLVSALEVCAYVQSVPEQGLAVVNIGKRDVAFDAGLPQVIAHYRDGVKLPLQDGDMNTYAIMDQHAMLNFGAKNDLRVGDILVFSTSHPCLTFDKWRTLYLADEQYNVLEAMDTGF